MAKEQLAMTRSYLLEFVILLVHQSSPSAGSLPTSSPHWKVGISFSLWNYRIFKPKLVHLLPSFLPLLLAFHCIPFNIEDSMNYDSYSCSRDPLPSLDIVLISLIISTAIHFISIPDPDTATPPTSFLPASLPVLLDLGPRRGHFHCKWIAEHFPEIIAIIFFFFLQADAEAHEDREAGTTAMGLCNKRLLPPRWNNETELRRVIHAPHLLLLWINSAQTSLRPSAFSRRAL